MKQNKFLLSVLALILKQSKNKYTRGFWDRLLDPYRKFMQYRRMTTLVGEKQKIEIPYTRVGNPDGPKVVCLPGLLGIEPYFYPLLTKASLERYEFYIPDNVVFHLERADIDTVTTFSKAFIDAMGLQQVHLIANSLGCIVAQKLADSHPDMVSSIAMLGFSGDPEYYTFMEDQQARKEASEKRENLSTDHNFQIDVVSDLIHLPTARVLGRKVILPWKFPLRFVWHYNKLIHQDKQLLSKIMRLGAMTKRYSIMKELRRSTIPMGIVHGLNDKIVHHQCVRNINKLPHVWVRLLPHCGHEVLGEHADAPGLILDFIGKQKVPHMRVVT